MWWFLIPTLNIARDSRASYFIGSLFAVCVICGRSNDRR
jgi:hypothetical protein